MNFKQITTFLALATLAFSSQLFAAGSNSNYLGPDRDADGNIVPTPKGEKCVEETSYMRKNHMDLLLHKRDETMHKGIRTKKYSLAECINCHVTPNEDGKISRISDDDNKHFCASCHASAAVTLDCFECHADRPISSFKKTSNEDLLRIINNRQSLKPHAVLNKRNNDKGKL